MLCLALAGYEATGTTTVSLAKAEAIPSGHSITLEVLGDGAHPEVVQDLRARLFGSLLAEGLFSDVVPALGEADYRLTVALTDMTVISGGERMIVGVLAPGDGFRADVRLVESASDRTITEYNVETEAASDPRSPEAGIDVALRKATARIIAGLR